MAKGSYYYFCLKDYDTAVRYFEQARQLLPNSSRIPESLAYVARRRGQWDRSESYFNEAEQLDPRNVYLLTQHANTYIYLRRFPEALRKLEQVLDITPDDVDALALKAAIAQAEGDLPHASALLAPLRPAADDSSALETQVYQAILERRPASIIPRLKEILSQPDPALGYINGGLRFWLGWAQEAAGDHAAAQETWRQARSELESFLKDQPENYTLIGYLALANMGLGDKDNALALSQRAMAANPIEKDAVTGPIPIEILARVAAQMGEPDRAIAALQKLLSVPYAGAGWKLTAHSCAAPARSDVRSAPEQPALPKTLQRTEAMNVRSFFAELKQRNVYKVGIAYALVAWLLIQVASQIFPFFEIPNRAVRLVVLLLIIGFPVALILAWAFDLTPEGLKRTKSADDLPAGSWDNHVWIYVIIVGVALSICLFFVGRYTVLRQTGTLGSPAKSIAVLPFENLSHDPDNAYFADGVQDEILTDLAKSPI